MERSPRLRELALRRVITGAQHRAGDMFRGDLQAGEQSGLRHRGADRRIGGEACLDLLVLAIRRGRKAGDLIRSQYGEVGQRLTIDIVLKDRSATELAEELGWRVTSPMDVFKGSLDLLCGFYGAGAEPERIALAIGLPAEDC